MADLVSLDEAKRALRREGDTEEDDELQRLLDESEFAVLDAVKNRVSDASDWEAIVDAWTEETLPKDVKGAILHQFVAVERFRGGDEPKSEPTWIQGFAPRAWRIIERYRDPSLA